MNKKVIVALAIGIMSGAAAAQWAIAQSAPSHAGGPYTLSCAQGASPGNLGFCGVLNTATGLVTMCPGSGGTCQAK